MDEYIRKVDAVDTVPKERIVEYMDEFGAGYNSCRNDILGSIESLTPADVVPVRHGTWLPIVSYNNTYKCSECGRLLVDITDGLKMVAKNYPYCHCGAKMDEKGEK